MKEPLIKAVKKAKKAVKKSKAVRKKVAKKTIREKAAEGAGILMPHINHRFRVVFDDRSEVFQGLTRQVNSVDVDFLGKKLTVKLREVLADTIISQANEFAKTVGNIEVQYLTGIDANAYKGIRFYGKTTGLTTSYSYASEMSGITILTLEYEFHDFNEYFPDED